jgi:tetratricopeptide (TPR) repeat protein/predicted Ser/Thr protein kinase
MADDIPSLFRQVVDLSPSERIAWFDRNRVPAATREEIESLLQFDGGTEHPISACVTATVQQFVGSGPNVGSLCGAYRLVRLLGRGGMGAVFLGERQDGEVSQRAAIKFVRNMAPRERFLRERQVLASLNHAGIARLLDAGRTDGEQPYMVMEYVEGVSLDVYCRDLDLRAKLQLFLKLADAVTYAHRNLVIHRDLKPSNILVDSNGQPKVLDFGIARMLDDSDKGATTELVLTPEYASPEQLRGSAHTTATDIYSLGAVLYYLLTGRSPHALPPGSNKTMEEVITRQDPPPPSQLNAALPRDIDFIVSKALRKEPEERYPAVADMAEDISAVLESRPVRARAGNAWYRARKFLRRQWLPVTAAAVIVLLSVIGFFEVNRERNVAQRRFQQLQQLAGQVLEFDSDIQPLPGSTKARQKMVTVSMAYLDGLAREASGDPDLARRLADGYLQLGKVQGVPTTSNLGQFPEAESSLAKAESYVQVALRAHSADPALLEKAVEIVQSRMIVADSRQRRAEALAFADQCVARLEELARNSHAPPELIRRTVTFWLNVANAYMNQNHYEEAVRYGRHAVEIGRSYGAPNEALAAGMSLVANALRQTGDLDGALAAIVESRKLLETAKIDVEWKKASVLYTVLWRQGQILDSEGSVSLGRPDEAIEPLQLAFDSMEELASKDAHDMLTRDRVGTAALHLGDVLSHRSPAHALEVYGRGIQRQREIPKSNRARRMEAKLLAHSAYALIDLHRPREARDRVSTALKLLEQTKDYPATRLKVSAEAVDILLALARIQSDSGDLHGAFVTINDLLDRVMASKPPAETILVDAASLSQIYKEVAQVDRRAGDSGRAADLDARRLALWRRWQAKLPGNPFVERQVQAAETH